jgi:hypothetical protein
VVLVVVAGVLLAVLLAVLRV